VSVTLEDLALDPWRIEADGLAPGIPRKDFCLDDDWQKDRKGAWFRVRGDESGPLRGPFRQAP
jgi:hypothetical protein